MKTKDLFFVFVFMGNLISYNCISQSTRNATLVADAFISEAAHSSNFGSNALLNIGLENDGRVNASLLKFDLGSFQGKVHIHSANLTLFYYPGVPAERVVGEVFRIISNWSESSVIFDNSPKATYFDQYFFAGTGGSSLSINMTSIVRQWLENGYPNYGFGLSPWGIVNGEITPDGNVCFFYTKEGSSTYKPQLTFQYSYLDVFPDAFPIVGAQPGGGTFKVYTNVGWSVSDDAQWLTATKTDGSTISVSYNENTSTSSRTAYITASTSYLSETVIVEQAGASPYIDIAPNNIPVNSSSGTATFNVSSNVVWTVSDDVSWLTAVKNGNSINVSYTENTSTAPRTANISVSGSGVSKTVTVIQSGIVLYLDVSPNTRSVGSLYGVTTYNVSSNVVWTVSDDASWLTATKIDNETITVTYDENLFTNSRIANISVSGEGVSETVIVEQAGASPYIDIAPNNIPVNSSSGTATFNVSSNVVWTVSDDVSWLTAVKNGNSINVSYTENTSTAPRTANISVSGEGVSEIVILVQSGSQAYIDLSPKSRQVNHQSGTTIFSVDANVNWNVSEDESWLTATKTDGSTITVTYDANPSINSRTANITASDSEVSEIVTLIQSGFESVTLSISPDIYEVSSYAGNVEFNIFSNANWEVFVDVYWLTIMPFDGNGDGTITAIFVRNDTGEPRIATIRVFSGEINISAIIIQESLIDGIESNNATNIIQFYPNPVKETLSVKHSFLYVSVKMFSLSGQMVVEFENVPSSFECDLSNISKGIYLIQFITDRGEYVLQKIIVD